MELQCPKLDVQLDVHKTMNEHMKMFEKEVRDMLLECNQQALRKAVTELEPVFAPVASWRNKVTASSSWEQLRQCAKPLFAEAFVEAFKTACTAGTKVGVFM